MTFWIRRTPPGWRACQIILINRVYTSIFRYLPPPYPPARPKNPLRAAGSRACWNWLLEVPHLVHTPLCCFFSLVVFLGRFSTESNLLRDPLGDRGRMLFWNKISMFFPTSFSVDIFSILGPIWDRICDISIDFSMHFWSIEFASILNRFSIEFWHPCSCKKTILTLYSSLKTRNRRFQNFTDLSLILDLVLASFWKHFLIISHTFSPSIFGSIFGCIFMENLSKKGASDRPCGRHFGHTFRGPFRRSTF